MALWVMPPARFALPSLAVSLIGWAGVWLLVQRGLPQHGYPQFGLANTITATRAAITVAVAAVIPMADALTPVSGGLWSVAVAVLLALLLDGVDGYVARTSGQPSGFGARFDMEVDAAMALVISVLLWQLDKCGAWVLGLGLMRYAFVLAAWRNPALAAPLFPSQRRRVICVVQIASLCLMLVPAVAPSMAAVVGGVALLLLAASFLRDTIWLLQRSGT